MIAMKCRFCDGDASEPDHAAHCDGRQGALDWDSEHYPDAPGYQDTDTSFNAAQSMREKAASMRAMSVAQLRAAWLTSDETALRLGVNKYTIRARFAELHMQGVIEDTGHRRENVSGHKAIVWRLTGETDGPRAA